MLLYMCGDSEIVFMGILGTHAIPIMYPLFFIKKCVPLKYFLTF